MGGLKLINKTDKNIILYEGSGGVYRAIKEIPAGEKHELIVEPHETYREYKCKFPIDVLGKSEAIVLNSDDIATYTHLMITWDAASKKLSYVVKKQSESSAVAESKASFSVVRWLISKFSWKKELPPNDEEVGGGDGRGDSQGGAGGAAGGSGGNDDANVVRHGGSVESFQGPTLSSSV